MPQRIDVPGMGVVEFPDGMNDDQIAGAIRQNMPQQQSSSFKLDPAKGGPDNNLLNIGADIGRVALGGLTRGAMAIPDMANLARAGFNAALDKVMPPTPQQQQAKAAAPQPIGSNEAVKAVESATGIDTRPEAATTTTGRMVAPYVKTASEFVPTALMTGGGAITGGVIPGIASEAAGQLSSGKWYEPLARIGGAIAGGVGGARAITPAPANAERQALVDTLRGEGVVTPTQAPIPFVGQPGLTAGQATGSTPLRWMESALGDIGGGRASSIVEQGKEQLGAAALRRIGENATRTTPDVMDRALTRIGDTFETIGARNVANVDREFLNDVRGTWDQYARLANPLQRPVIDSAIQDITDVIRTYGGAIPGDVYNSMRSRLTTAARDTSDNQVRRGINGLVDALDGALERSAAAAGRAGDAEALRGARREYRNFFPLQDAATAAGSDAAQGLVSPQALQRAVINQNPRGYVRGQGDYADLARAGAGVMTTPPNSGTPARSYMTNLLPTLLSGGTLGGVLAGAPGAAVGTAGALSPLLLGRALMSRPVQAYLANQAAPYTAREQLARTLMESGGAQRQ